MSPNIMSFTSIEPLEARIAPAAVVYPTIIDAENDLSQRHFKTASVGTPVLLQAGDVLTTGSGARNGSYLMFVEKGQALVFTTDFNNNNRIDTNEITGIAAGDGLRLISFVDIHGDIVTNLRDNTTLSDSDNNSANDDISLKGDGRVLLNNRIEKIELRSLTALDITDQNGSGGIVDDFDVAQRLVLTSYSIFGTILTGGGFGVQDDPTSGLIVDDAGRVLLQTYFSPAINPFGPDYYDETATPLKPRIGGVKVGTAAAGEYFSFGIGRPGANDGDGNGDLGGRDVLRNGNDTQGVLRTFTPAPGTTGGGIFYVRANSPTTTFDVGQFVAGNGGINGAGGNVEHVTLNGDGSGGYIVQAGNGGNGSSGGMGGAILEFSDLGSNTSDVIIRSGSGGVANNGVGGNAGSITFANVNLLGGVTVDLGDGGTGFTGGGRGASLEKAIITTPDRLIDNVNNIVGTTHDTKHDPATGRRILLNPLLPGAIGQNNSVDFDEDGFGDFVVTSFNPAQTYIQFTDGFGAPRFDPVSLRPDRIYLDSPINAEALTIGDFDGDGHLDIAAGSSATGTFSGVAVYLSKFEDTNGDGILTSTEDINHNGVDDLLGFRTVRYSPIPEIADTAAVRRSAHAITDVEAGDFNGDGFTDLAVTATFYTPLTLESRQVLFFMYSDVEDGKPTGQFYADFGTKGQSVPQVSPNPFTPYVLVSNGLTVNIEVTSLDVFSDHDVVLSLASEGNRRRTIEIYDNSIPSIGGPAIGGFELGRVDTNRRLPDGGNSNVTLEAANGGDFAVVDFDHDGVADFSVLVEEPAGYLITLRGDGAGGAARIDLPFLDPAGNNAGFYFGPDVNDAGGIDVGTEQLAIISADTDADGFVDDIAVLANSGNNPDTVIFELSIGYPPPDGVAPDPDPLVDPIVGVLDNPGAQLNATYTASDDTSTTIFAFDVYHPFAGDTATVNYAVEDPETSDIDGGNLIWMFGDTTPGVLPRIDRIPFGFFIEVTEHFLDMRAGHGGDSLVGRGGDGGNIGSGAIDPTTLVGVVDIHTNLGLVNVFGGDGGNGFTLGGKGGSVIATLVDGSLTSENTSILGATFTGGNGGLALSGAGGAGGDLIGNSAFGGFLFTAGNGGRGIIGGNGGSIIGHGIAGFYDTQDIDHTITAGTGGNGIKRGGNGGNITDFHASLDLIALFETGTIIYLGGNGGTAVSGPGGNGGNVVNTSPLEVDRNQLAGDIYLAGGKGGNGLSGGNGGSVNTFVNKTDQLQLPAVVTFIGGDGGNGTKKRGGNGGGVLNVDTASTGFPNIDAIPATAFDFTRVIAGRGGDSSGGAGGNGGNVSNVKISVQEQVLAIVAGAGGDGLFKGGVGGSVNTVNVTVGSTAFGKAVVIAGQGGDANAYLANINDPTELQTAIKAFGGRIGKGGNGGSIANVDQSGGISSRIDLIAGNGGDTVNYGTVGDVIKKKSLVGKGGDISHITAAGSIGNLDPAIPIKSYNNVLAGETMDDFVQRSLRDESAPGSLTDAIGNVGLVVGAAGRIKQVFAGYDPSNNPIFPSKPAPGSAKKGAVNGSILDIEARLIMSAVAGNVERIAAIQSVQDIRLGPPGFPGSIGADKPGLVRFVDSAGSPTTTPVLDGRLIDGAMVTRVLPKKNLGSDVYVVS